MMNMAFYSDNEVDQQKQSMLKQCKKVKGKTVAFCTPRLSLRGTEVALYDYAHYNETMLNNKSIIITHDYNTHKDDYEIDELAYVKFGRRFPRSLYFFETLDDICNIVKSQHVDVLYVIKYGINDGLSFPNSIVKTVIHTVFLCSEEHKHGAVYSPISPFLNQRYKTNWPVVPHIVQVADTDEDFRSLLNLPKEAIVFGTYSGSDNFDIQYIKDVVTVLSTVTSSDEQDDEQQSNKNKDKDGPYAHVNIRSSKNKPLNRYRTTNSKIYFIFMNVKPFMKPNKHAIFCDGTADPVVKRKFINTCDAMLYGRSQGETFGLSIGEFSICNKPILCPLIPEPVDKNHLQLLNKGAITYTSAEQLIDVLTNWPSYRDRCDPSTAGYNLYTPRAVMEAFNTIFIQ